MNRNGIKLPAHLLRELGLPDASHKKYRHGRRLSSRKEDRKAARVQKRQPLKTILPAQTGKKFEIRSRNLAGDSDEEATQYDHGEEEGSSDDVDDDISELEQKPKPPAKKRKASETESEEPKEPKISRRVRERLAEDDAEIAALERRLGIKKGKKLPKSFDEDGLNDLLGDLGDDKDEEPSERSGMTREEKAWLDSKRERAIAKKPVAPLSGDEDVLSEDDDEELSPGDSEMLEDSFAGFQDEDKEPLGQPRQRENPYVAPTIGNKYIPPSLRKTENQDQVAVDRLRRQIQGTLNRLSEAKVLSIAADVEMFYGENPRQHVTSTLLDALYGLICDPAPLQDTFMILHGGFVAALYKTMGTDFGAQVVQRLVDVYDKLSEATTTDIGKQLSNLATFMAELYNFQVIGSKLMFDIVRQLAMDLSEDNAEILLRITRLCGSQLRSDDPSALKDIVDLLHTSMQRLSADKLSVRTRFTIEHIEALKNNKVKTGISASVIVSEHTTTMKKTLGSINRSSIKAHGPLQIGLQDIRNADRKGRWWLVGAAFKDDHQAPDIDASVANTSTKQMKTREKGSEIDLDQLARDQGMITEIRRVIFISIVSAYDHKEACTRLDKLGMKKNQRHEIPRVLIHCVGAEKLYYNRFYTRIAKELSKDRNIRKAFSFALWDVFKRVEDEEDDEISDQLDFTSMVYIAKMFGELVADGSQSILLLKHLDLTHPPPRLKTFAEVLLITIFQRLQRNLSKKNVENIKKCFAVVKQEPEMIPSLQLFLRKKVRKTRLVENREDIEKVQKGCKAAEAILLELTAGDVGEEQ